MFKNLILFVFFVQFSFLGLSQNSWSNVKQNKKGTIVLNYSNADVFISDKTGTVKGIEYDVMLEFVNYVSKKHDVDLVLELNKKTGFNVLYSTIINGESGNFGASSFSITEKRKSEVNFSPKYMNDVETMISSTNLPVFKDTAEFLKYINDVKFLVVPNTTYEEDFNEILALNVNPKVLFVDEGTEILKDYYLKDNFIGFAELPTYFVAKKEGFKIKRQNLFKFNRNGYGIIYPLDSDWKPIIDEFFNNENVKQTINLILQKHLGSDINELILNLSGDENDEFLLLTKEKELQEVEIELNELTILNDALEKENLIAETKLKEEESLRDKVYLFSGLIIASLILIFVGIAYRNKSKSNQIIFKQKQDIEAQHSELIYSHKQISDSITYAKRLQLAILPSMQELDENLGDGFVLFKPKDIVSGDFYWLYDVDGVRILTVADCTGHGVPGAMVSVVCNEALNRSVKEFGLREPKDILNKSKELIVNTFAKSGENIQDGMDICMVTFVDDYLLYSGAYNPLWIIRSLTLLTEAQKNAKGTIIDGDFALIEYKANKQPVGLYEDGKPFEQIKVSLYKNDKLYLFTDGFADQFGGERNKKFKSKPFKKLLLANSNLPMNDQQVFLNNTFDTWKGTEEQVDDVCIIGVSL